MQAMQVETIKAMQSNLREGHLGVSPTDDEAAASFNEPSFADLKLMQFGRTSSTAVVTPPPPDKDDDGVITFEEFTAFYKKQ